MAKLINKEHRTHQEYARGGEPFRRGRTVKIATARKAVLRANISGKEKQKLLKRTQRMLQMHKNAAEFELEIEQRSPK